VLEGRNCFTEEDSETYESNNTNITKNMSVEFQSSFSTKSKTKLFQLDEKLRVSAEGIAGK
jgi:hypothetical protein